ncbi:MAG: CDP-alcohol phosphatidyltransferase family protein [Gemmatimonadales bacterium]
MSANWITLSRFPLLLIWTLLLYLATPWLRLAGIALLLLGLMLDTVDGVVARRTGQVSLFGSVLDIAADRTYELVLWVCFADLGMIPAAVPLIVVARTTLTDALRSVGIAEGAAPFDQHRTAFAQWVVGSRWMRTGYSVTKVTAFCGLALAESLSGFPPGTALESAAAPMLDALQPVVWLAVALCVCRGMPVLFAGLPRLRRA